MMAKRRIRSKKQHEYDDRRRVQSLYTYAAKERGD